VKPSSLTEGSEAAVESAAPSVAAALMGAVAFDYASWAMNAPWELCGMIKLKGSAINREVEGDGDAEMTVRSS
jgi:hypothetical protein